MEDQIKHRADELLEEGEIEALYALLAPYLALGDPYAQFLYSSFSLESTHETEEEFEKRSMKMLLNAADGGVAEASYRLGVMHLYSDSEDINPNEASGYFERAIAQGHSYSKFTLGFNLYYGYSGTQQDQSRGIKLLQEAAQEGVALAKDELAIIGAKI